MVPVEFFFVLSALLFFIGVFGFVTRRNLIAMLISVELVLNSVDINFAAFNRLLFPGQMEGFFFTLFSIGVVQRRRRLQWLLLLMFTAISTVTR